MSKVKGIALVEDNVASDTSVTEGEDGGTAAVVANQADASVGWLIITSLKWAGLLESLIRCFHFLAIDEARRTSTKGTMSGGDDGVDKGPVFLFWSVKGASAGTIYPGHPHDRWWEKTKTSDMYDHSEYIPVS